MASNLEVDLAARVQLQVGRHDSIYPVLISSPSRVMPAGEEWTNAQGVPQPLFGYWSLFWGILCEVDAFVIFSQFTKNLPVLPVRPI